VSGNFIAPVKAKLAAFARGRRIGGARRCVRSRQNPIDVHFAAGASLLTFSRFHAGDIAMTMTRRHALALAASFAASSTLPAHGQSNWPKRSLRILIGTTPGGSPDIIGRLLADKMTGPLGQSISVENNTGGGGGIAAGIVSHAPPDGYAMTLLTAGYASGAAVGKFKYDGDKTFGHITMVCSYPFVYLVPKDSPIKSFPDMLARARANPGKLSYVITSLGAVYHLIGSWVGGKAGIDMTPISYRGSSAAVTDVMSGRVDVMLEPATSGFPRIHSGQFRVLAVTSPQRYALMPEAPTVAETLPGVAYMSWLGMATSPGTPRPVIARLNKEIHRALELPEVKQKLKEAGNIGTPTTPEAMKKQMQDEIANWKGIVAANKIKLK
jgi:tripartite-type tricarboxylate transporter receptor subunit TctC